METRDSQLLHGSNKHSDKCYNTLIRMFTRTTHIHHCVAPNTAYLLELMHAKFTVSRIELAIEILAAILLSCLMFESLKQLAL